LTDPAADPPEVRPFPVKAPTEAPSVWKRLLKRLPGLSVRLGIVAIAAVIAVVFALRWDAWVGGRIAQTTDDAYVRADITPLSAKVEGYVRNVVVGDFQRVKAGDLLVQIEDDDYKARVDQAKAAVAGAEAAIEKSHKAQRHRQLNGRADAVMWL
jgi:membrane fusion protein, multidrug efflux system